MTSTLTRANALKLMAGLLAAEVLSAFELSMLYAALRFMISDFGSAEAVGWVMTSFFLASAVSAAICGRLGDIFGRKKVLLIVIFFSIIGSLIAAFSTTLEGVILGRVIQGTAGAIFPLCIGLVRENVKPESAPMFIGILAASLTVTMGLGTFLGGVIVDNFSWHGVFFAGALAGIVAFIAIYFWMPRSSTTTFDRRTNILGGILFAPAVVLLLLTITKAPSWGWTSTSTVLCLVAGLFFMTVWVATELRAKVPLLDVRLLANRQVLLVNLGSAVLGLTAFQSLQVWSIVLQQPTATGVGLGVTATLAGLILFPKTLIALASGPTAGWLITHYSGRASMVAGATIMMLGWIILAMKHDSLIFLTLMLTFLGFGMSMFYSSIPIIISQVVPMERTSEANGMMLVIRSTAMGIGAQIVAYTLDTSTIEVAGASFPDQTAVYRVIAYVIGGCMLMILISLFVSKDRAKGPVSTHAMPMAPVINSRAVTGK